MRTWGGFGNLESVFQDLVDAVGDCMDTSFEAINKYIEEGENGDVRALFDKVHSLESDADQHKRKIISEIIGGSLMPNTRMDLMNLVENIDDIADAAEEVVDYTILPALDISEVNKKRLDKIMELLGRQYGFFKEAVMFLFQDMEQSYAEVGKLELIESDIDELEEEIIRRLASRSDIGLAEKLACRDFVTKLGDLADIIENAGDVIEMIIAVRKG